MDPVVPTGIRNNIRRLLMHHHFGLQYEQFLDKYEAMFGQRINFRDLKFDSLKSLLLSMNETVLHMRYVREKYLLYLNLKEPGIDYNPLPNRTEPSDFFLELYPNAVGPNEIIPQERIPFNVTPGSYLKVLVAEVYTPSHFWIQLQGRKSTVRLRHLMNDLQTFYLQENRYKMPDVTVRIGQFCVAPFNGEWHRVKITEVPNLIEAQVFYVDYGTTSKIRRSELRFMHKNFADLPMQAIRSSLANLSPANQLIKWPRSVSERFLDLVDDKNLIAIVSSVNHEACELELVLVDTSQEEDIYINDLLKNEGLAVFGTIKKPQQPVVAAPTPVPVPAAAPQQRVGTEKITHGVSVTRPPPGFTSVPIRSEVVPTPALGTSLSSTISEAPTSVKTPIASTLTSHTSPIPSVMSTVPSSTAPSVISTAPITADFISSTVPLLNAASNNSQNQTFLQQQQQGIASNLGHSCFLPPASNATSFVNSSGFNPLLAGANQLANAAVTNPLASAAAIKSNLGSLDVNITDIPNLACNTTPTFTSQSASHNIKQTVSSEPIVSIPPSPPPVQTSEDSYSELEKSFHNESIAVEVDTVNVMMSKMEIVDVQMEGQSEKLVKSPSKAANSTSSTDSSVLEQFDIVSVMKLDSKSEVPETYESVPAIEELDDSDDLIYSSDDEYDDPDVEKEVERIMESSKTEVDNAMPMKRQYVRKVELARKTVHVINVKSTPYLCTDEIVSLFTEFSGRHVILMILDSKNITLPFREIGHTDEPDIIKALEEEDIIGIPKRNGFVAGRVHLTPLQMLPQLMIMLKMQNREVYRAALEEIERFHSFYSQDSYWTQQNQ